NRRQNLRTPHRKARGFLFPASTRFRPESYQQKRIRSGKFPSFAFPSTQPHRTTPMTSSTSTKIAIVGYGSQGRAHALNLRDSGFDVTVGLRPGGPTEAKAQADGFVVKSPAEAVKDADLVAVLTPDMVQKKLYEEVLRDNLKQGAVLLFAHGLNVHFGMIAPREDLDVVLVAPKGPGALVRREYEIGRGVPCIYAVYQDKSGKAEEY